MKNLKKIALVALLAGSPVLLRAQEYKAKFSSKQDRKVVLEMQGGDVTVEGYDGDEVVIKGNGFEEPPKRAEGLRPVYNTAQDNTRLGLAVSSAAGNTVRIVKASRKSANYIIQVPRRADVVFTQINWNGGDLVVRDLAGRVEATLKTGDLRALNMAGPVVANSVSGNITVRFSAVPAMPSALSTVSGEVDVSLPAPAKATLDMRTVSGEIYTDFELTLTKGADGMHHVGGATVEGRVNGGGSSLSLKSVSGDIFLRKAK